MPLRPFTFPFPLPTPLPSPLPPPTPTLPPTPFAPSRPSDPVTSSVQCACIDTGPCERSCGVLASATPCLQRCCCCCCCCCCCFSHSAEWLPTRKKLLYTVVNLARGLLNREKKKCLAAPLPHAARSEKIKIKIPRCILMSRRYASRRYAGLDPYRVRMRIPTTRRLGQWVSLRKNLRFRVR